MAIESPNVIADVVEVNEFPHLAQRYAIRGVPKTVINETVDFIGSIPESQFVEHIQRASCPSAS